MTVLLVLFTLILFLVLDHFVQKSRSLPSLARNQVKVHGSLPLQFPIHIPKDVSLATNHTWLRTNRDGTVTIGIDEFLSRLVGRVEKISIPREGEIIAPVIADIALGVRGHSLRLAPPMSGNVVESNHAVLENASLILSDPYGEGWLFRAKVRTNDIGALKKYVVFRPIEWLREQAGLVRDFIVMNSQHGQPVMMQEGGLPMDGVMQQFDDGVWKDFRRSFTVLHKTKDTEREENQI